MNFIFHEARKFSLKDPSWRPKRMSFSQDKDDGGSSIPEDAGKNR